VAKKSFSAIVGRAIFYVLRAVLLLLFKLLKWAARALLGVLAGFGSAAGKEVFKAARTATNKAAVAAAPKPQAQALADVSAFEGSVSGFEDWLYASKSTVGIILGSRGSGKTGLGLRLVENWASRGRKAFAMGFAGAGLPAWIGAVVNAEAVPNNAVLLVDEGGIFFSSRESMSDANRLLSKLLFIARHKDISVLFISQNSANLEVNTIRQADYLLLKKPSLLQKDFERDKIKDIYADVAADFKKFGADKGLVYIYSDQFRGFASNSLPSFWSERTSKAFGKTQISR
jgi:hypothetical protein